MSDEKVPENCDELKQAVQQTGDNDTARQQLLIKQAVDMGCVEHIPDNWGLEAE